MEQTIELPLAALRIDGGTQPREELNLATVRLYAEAMRGGEEFPPARAVFDGKDYWLYGGFHRYHARRQTERQTLPVLVTPGTADDARWLALSENKEHDRATTGLRRSNAEKRRAVESALRLRPEMTNVDLGEHVGVSEFMVRSMRPAVAPSSIESKMRTVERGKQTFRMDTANIGKRPPAPREESPTPAPEIGPAEESEAPQGRSTPAPPPAPHIPPVGLARAIDAINSLSQIPVNDPQRERAFQKVSDYLKTHSRR